MEFNKHKEQLNRELDQFNALLAEVLPRYIELMHNKDLNETEVKELGEIEHYLIELNGKIADIKNKLDHDLFGETLDYYYAVKEKAKSGDVQAKVQFEKLRKALSETVKGDSFFNWN